MDIAIKLPRLLAKEGRVGRAYPLHAINNIRTPSCGCVDVLSGFGTTMSEDRLNVLTDFQHQVRSAFNWDYQDDLTSATEMADAFSKQPPYGVKKWSDSNRTQSLDIICKELKDADCVKILGAAVKQQDVENFKQENFAIIASDGAVGVIDDFENLICIVSDLDGGLHLDKAAKNGQRFIIHAHGDNISRWKKCLDTWSCFPSPPEIILSNQVDEKLEGMHNFGGFTDGDRAVCFALWAGVDISKIELVGFSTGHIGEWSGTTNTELKFDKLSWMKKILAFLNLDHQIKM